MINFLTVLLNACIAAQVTLILHYSMQYWRKISWEKPTHPAFVLRPTCVPGKSERK